MKFNREAKNMLAVMALVLAIAIALNAALVPDADRDMWSWTISLLAVAVALWIWSRRDSAVARDAEAAEEAVQEAEEHAKRTIVRHADERPAPDDLTRVNGIGGVFQTMLNDAGILTYSALASASVEDLEAIIDATGRSRPDALRLGRLKLNLPRRLIGRGCGAISIRCRIEPSPDGRFCLCAQPSHLNLHLK